MLMGTPMCQGKCPQDFFRPFFFPQKNDNFDSQANTEVVGMFLFQTFWMVCRFCENWSRMLIMGMGESWNLMLRCEQARFFDG